MRQDGLKNMIMDSRGWRRTLLSKQGKFKHNLAPSRSQAVTGFDVFMFSLIPYLASLRMSKLICSFLALKGLQDAEEAGLRGVLQQGPALVAEDRGHLRHVHDRDLVAHVFPLAFGQDVLSFQSEFANQRVPCR